MLINESNNWIWGRSQNPWNTKRSTGGSSGGEAGLITLGISPIGFGSDGGGSVRIPCLYCGIAGLRPTLKRTTVVGHKKPGQYAPRHIFAVGGPLGKTVDDVKRGFMGMVNHDLIKQYDHFTRPIYWNQTDFDETYKKKNGKLRIGYYINLKVISFLILN